MSLAYTQRPYSHYSRLSGRRVVGVVLHHSAVSVDVTTAQSGGGWHWMIGTSTLYKDVPEPYAAWHCGATDRWRPPWVPVGAGQGKVSDINAVSIGIEMTYAPQDGEVPNAYQYDTLKALLADLYARYGELPIIGHGQVDLSRWPTEPHALDWTRAHLGPLGPNGRYFVQEDDVTLTADQQAILDKMAALNANAGSIDSWISQIGALGEQNDQLKAEVASLVSQVAHAARKATKITYDDGSSQELGPAA